MNRLLSPRQVARAIGVSESSLKRWCDQGLIGMVRTVGGHRKLPIGDVIRFVRERDQPIVRREILGLPPQSELELDLDRGAVLLAEALLCGNETLAKRIVFDFFLAKDSLSAICDDVISKAFLEIGHRWECGTAETYQQRRGCEFVQRILFELRRSQQEPDTRWNACGGTFSGDIYSLPTTMVELVLRDAGWNATSLGASIPADSMVKAMLQLKPDLFWVCASQVHDADQFVADFHALWEAAQSVGAALVIGGRAFTKELRQRLTYCSYCDTMQQLEAYGRSMRRLGSAHRA